MPKCKKCGIIISAKEAFVVSNGKTNFYYCNKQEYTEDKIRREKEKKIYDLINYKVFDIFGYSITNTAYYKELNRLHGKYSWERIWDCILENEQELDKAMRKDFDKEYGRIRYFIVVLENKLSEYQPPPDTFVKSIEYDMPETKYKRKKQRKTLEDFEREAGD